MKPRATPLLLLGLAAACQAQTPPATAPARPEGQANRAASAGSSPSQPAPLPRLILGGSQTKPATPAAARPAPAPTQAPAAPVAAKKAAKEDEAPARIAGLEIARGDKGFLGLQVSGGTFQLGFYDAKKKPAKADVARAVLRWTPNYKPGTEFYVLEPSADGQMLTSPRVVRSPYHFKLYVSLFAAGVDQPAESFVLDFRQ